MRVAALEVLIAAAAIALARVPAHAFDDGQFCVAAKEVLRAAVEDVGTWTDRLTRHDGIDIGCDLKTVHFKRFYKSAAAPSTAWMERQAEVWEGTYCSRSIWRDASTATTRKTRWPWPTPRSTATAASRQSRGLIPASSDACP